MRSTLHVPQFFCLLFALFGVASAAEFHQEHRAVHQTALWRRSSNHQHEVHAHRAQAASQMQVEIGADADVSLTDSLNELDGEHDRERLVNISTELHDQKTEYIGSIGVGTGSDGLSQFDANVVFDTGSTNLWVASVLCKEYPCDGERGKLFYDPLKSSTQEEFEGEKRDIDILFGTGELKGPIHVDTYHVGPMKVKRMAFAMIRHMNGAVFSSFPFEGILGLGFKSLSFGGIKPFFEHVIDQKLLEHNEFAFYFNVDSNQPSALLWGGIDPDLYHGKIRMFPVVQPHYWALDLLDFRIGNTSMVSAGLNGDRVKRLIVDSGTTYFTAPNGMHDKITEKIRGANCKDVTNYEPLVYVLRGADGHKYELAVSQETYMISGYGGDCRPAFMALDVNHKYGPAMLLGEVFMRHFFTVFSRGDGDDKNAKVGFAPAKIGAEPKIAKAHAKPPTVIQKERKALKLAPKLARRVNDFD